MVSERNELRSLLTTLAVVVLLIALSVWGSLRFRPGAVGDAPLRLGAVEGASVPAGPTETVFARVFETVSASVAYLEAYQADSDTGSERTLDPGRPDYLRGGSGLVVREDGYLVTNAHVIEGAGTIRVLFEDGHELLGEVLGVDERTDIGVVRVRPSEPLPVVPLGDSDELRVGEFVLAVGAPFGFRATATRGIISGLHRRGLGLTDFEDFIVTDTAINRGNSGGPLVNLRGEVIGINTAIITRDEDSGGGFAGVSFAIPVNLVRYVASRLIRAAQDEPAGDAEEAVAEGLDEATSAVAGAGRVVAASFGVGATRPQAGNEPTATGVRPAIAYLEAQDSQGRRMNSGSALLIDEDGWLVTNAHVVNGAARVRVWLGEGEELMGESVAVDEYTDLAVVHVATSEPLTVALLGDSDRLRLGEAVLAVGMNQKRRPTVAEGRISGLDQGGFGISNYGGFIATTADIRLGNSGGPLINLKGETVGIVTALWAAEASGGLAIPINEVMQVVEALIRDGRVERSYAGFAGAPVVPAVAANSGLVSTDGVFVTAIAQGGPAHRAGLQRGDIIVSVGGEAIRDAMSWMLSLAEQPPGTTLALTFYRDRQPHETELQLSLPPTGGTQARLPSLGVPPESRLSSNR